MENEYRLLVDGLFHYLEENGTDEDRVYFQQKFSIRPPAKRGETPLRSSHSHLKRTGRGGVRLTPEERSA